MTGSGGHPVRRGVEVEQEQRGVLDHPLSRMMTSVLDEALGLLGLNWTSPVGSFATKQREKQKMPEITVSMAAGRTEEQKVGMMRDITQALVKNLGVDAEAVVIQINEAPLIHKMKGGKTFVERAAELKK
jgi:4-oxalocrotonate tautomerase